MPGRRGCYGTPMGEGKHQTTAPEPEVTNVDLQFMGRTDDRAELNATVEAESKAPGEFQERGMDKQDVAVAQSMVASDPPSTNMGEPDAEEG